ncbi:PREDICTED: 39S ribosomal protein L38, mitochondrial [Rhagoletis zephyria]|uniref:39S ribosomal protein L38, mitochondrial n=2 Tax=Rhagoletis zephyria TaxID=28612 RepID=UPI00081195FB|nr:PREDICTED: 39S ribosomal protein L38, mitochondrial [Rhagoletis zephyria]
MALTNLLVRNYLKTVICNNNPLLITARLGHTIRGKRPGVARSLEQRLQEENAKDPELTARVNIGFPRLKPSRSEQLKERLAHLKAQRSSEEVEKLARSNKLLIDLDEVQSEYRATNGQYDLRVIADHYGIFDDLFGLAYFVPRVVLNVKYHMDGDTHGLVYNGNVIKPAEAVSAPEVTFDGTIDPITGKKSEGDFFWTLVASNPDAHFSDSSSEYVHWFISNIPNGDVKKGEVLVDYLPPFPPKGVGYQRMIFVLYKQNGKLDFSKYKLPTSDKYNLEKRTFKTLDFYREQQDNITPAGLAFFQSDWDSSLTKFYHNALNMKEPIFEYDFPKPYLADQKFFPLKQAFNLYLDRHRDPKEVNKEYLERKLAKTHPFEGPEKPLRFPNAHPIRGVPSWLKTEIRKRRLGIGRINDYK